MTHEEEDFAALLAEFDQAPATRRQKLAVGDMVRGRIVSIGKEAAFVDLGGKAEGVLDRDQITDRDGKLLVEVGQEIEARIGDMSGGTVVLRTKLSRGPELLAELSHAVESGLPVEGTVMEVIKGGLVCQIAGQRAFCPASQIDNRFVEDLSVYVGQRLEFRVTKYEAGRGRDANMVVSRRALLEEAAAQQAEILRARLEPGLVVRGTVTTLKPYGAFVDLGGIEGMLHISELGHTRIEDPSQVLSVGQTVEVAVLKIEQTGDPKRPEKLSLSMKALERDPWQDSADGFAVGQVVKGTIVRLQPFGAFVEIAPGVEGLVHISELGAGRRINHPKEVVSEGEAVEATILVVDKAARRIGLSMAGAVRAVEDAQAASLPADQRAPKSLGTFADLLAKK